MASSGESLFQARQMNRSILEREAMQAKGAKPKTRPVTLSLVDEQGTYTTAIVELSKSVELTPELAMSAATGMRKQLFDMATCISNVMSVSNLTDVEAEEICKEGEMQGLTVEETVEQGPEVLQLADGTTQKHENVEVRTPIYAVGASLMVLDGEDKGVTGTLSEISHQPPGEPYPMTVEPIYMVQLSDGRLLPFHEWELAPVQTEELVDRAMSLAAGINSGKAKPKAEEDGKQGTFEEWLQEVDRIVESTAGLSYQDLTDQPYRDWFEDEVTAADAARRALEDNGFFA